MFTRGTSRQVASFQASGWTDRMKSQASVHPKPDSNFCPATASVIPRGAWDHTVLQASVAVSRSPLQTPGCPHNAPLTTTTTTLPYPTTPHPQVAGQAFPRAEHIKLRHLPSAPLPCHFVSAVWVTRSLSRSLLGPFHQHNGSLCNMGVWGSHQLARNIEKQQRLLVLGQQHCLWYTGILGVPESN